MAPGLKRVPGMSIDFAEYQDMVQAFFEAADRVDPRTASDEEVAEVERLALAMAPHQDIYLAWAQAQVEAYSRRLRQRARLATALTLLMLLAFCSWLAFQVWRRQATG